MTAQPRAFIVTALLEFFVIASGVHHAEPSQGMSKGAMMRKQSSSLVEPFRENYETASRADRQAVVVPASGLVRADVLDSVNDDSLQGQRRPHDKCEVYSKTGRGPVLLPILVKSEARAIGDDLLRAAMADYRRIQTVTSEATLRNLFQGSLKPQMESFISAWLGSGVNADRVYELLKQFKSYTVGPFVNYMNEVQYEVEHQQSWDFLARRYQERLYNKVLDALRSHLAPHPVRFLRKLNVTGWPFRIVPYSHLENHTLMRKVTYVGSPPHRDALWGRLGFEEMCSCKPSLWDPYSRHTISYTLALKVPQAGADLRIWRNPLDDFQVRDWMLQFLENHEQFDDVPYVEGVMVIHNGQEYHAAGEDNIFETHSNEHRITMQGHGVFCDGEWVVF